MAIKEIPRSFLYSCDVCNTDHLQENANGCYTNSTPPKWASIKFHRIIDAQVIWFDKLLCPMCADKFAEFNWSLFP